MRFKDIEGQTFGYLTAIRVCRRNKWRQIEWLCQCVCGNTCQATCGNLQARRGTRSCGCKRSEMVRKKLQLRPYEALYRALVRNASHPVVLTFTQFLKFTKIMSCHYCGVPLSWKPYRGESNGYKLDRKNNTLGYTVRNCVVCCARCNRGKGAEFTYSEWRQIGRVIASWLTSHK